MARKAARPPKPCVETVRPERTAYHEAGHAVVAVVMKVRVVEVSIIPDKKRGGVCWMRVPSRFLDLDDGLPGPGCWDLAAHWLPIFLAGMHAELRFLKGEVPADRFATSAHETAEANRLAMSLNEGDEISGEAYLQWIVARTMTLMGRPEIWRAVELVAAALLRRKTINGRLVRKLVRQARAESE